MNNEKWDDIIDNFNKIVKGVDVLYKSHQKHRKSVTGADLIVPVEDVINLRKKMKLAIVKFPKLEKISDRIIVEFSLIDDSNDFNLQFAIGKIFRNLIRLSDLSWKEEATKYRLGRVYNIEPNKKD